MTSGDMSRFEEFDVFYEKDTDRLRQIENLQKYGDFWRELTTDRRWLDPVERIFEAEVVLVNCSYMAKSAKVGSLAPFHQDNAYYFYVPDHALTVWLALDESDEENGCVRRYRPVPP